MVLQRQEVRIRLWNRQEAYEQTGSRVSAVEEVWCKRGAGNGLMANDTAGVPGYGERAWVGHSADTGSDGVAEQASQERW